MRSSRIAIASLSGMVSSVVCAAAVAAPSATERASVGLAGAESNSHSWYPSISRDGRFVAFHSSATNLVANDTNGVDDVFVYDRETGTTERVSVDSSGAEGNGPSAYASISADGRYVAFDSWADDLVAGDTNDVDDLFVRDRQAGTTERVSVSSSGAQADRVSESVPSISADGRFVTFGSFATNLAPGDTDDQHGVFLRDRLLGTTLCVSVAPDGGQADRFSWDAMVSADGRFVTFLSFSTNLVAGDANGLRDVFVRDLQAGKTELASVDSAGVQENGEADFPWISADGRFVSFNSPATNLVPGDNNWTSDVFVRDRLARTTERVSVDDAGVEANDWCQYTSISDDGRYVSFSSYASNLVPQDTNGRMDIFLRDRVADRTYRMSVGPGSVEGDGDCTEYAISGDGRVVAYHSEATNLVAGDANDCVDVFVSQLHPDAAWNAYGTGFPGTYGIPQLTALGDPVLGTTLTVQLTNSHGSFSLAMLFAGIQAADVPTNRGGHLLLVPDFAVYLALVPYGPTLFDADIELDEALCGLNVYAQAIEVDDGAAKGFSFTPGLDLLLGH